jgi:hypothetical protein
MKPILPLVIMFLIGTVCLAKADVLNLEATAGTIAKFKDETFGTVSGSGFVFRFHPLTGGLGIPSESQAPPVPGQVVDQSGQLFLTVRHANINGQDCCVVDGMLNLSAIPSASFLSHRIASQTLEVIAPFVVGGVLTARRDPSLPGPPFSVDYLFAGTGTVSNLWRGDVCGIFLTPCNFRWEQAFLTFTPEISPIVPETSTLLLLSSGLGALAFTRRQVKAISSSVSG